MKSLNFLTRKLFFIFGILLLIFFEVACEPKTCVDFIEPALIPEPHFLISQPDNSSEGRSTLSSVQLVDSEQKDVWVIKSNALYTYQGKFEIIYGKTPEGFKTLHSPIPLKVQETYILKVGGTGFGELKFLVGADGQLKKI